MWLMFGCFLFFLSILPVIQRDITLNGTSTTMPGVETIQQAMTSLLFGSMMLLPLVFYLIAFLAFLLTRALRHGATPYGARLAVFWGWLAASPVALFYGLLVGFNGIDHPGSVLIGAVWLAVLLWFWISGLAETSKVK